MPRGRLKVLSFQALRRPSFHNLGSPATPISVEFASCGSAIEEFVNSIATRMPVAPVFADQFSKSPVATPEPCLKLKKNVSLSHNSATGFRKTNHNRTI